MKIAVLVKQVPDTWGDRKLDPASGLLDRSSSTPVLDEIGERAIEVALRAKDADRTVEVTLVSMGPSTARESLLKGLAMGADSAIHVLDDALAGSDAARTATVLAAVLSRAGVDLVIAGNESTDGRAGLVPAMIAEHLGYAHLGSLESIEVTGTSVSGTRSTEYGPSRARAQLPAVATVTERIAEPRFAGFKGIMGAKKKPFSVVGLADLVTGDSGARSIVLSTTAPPSRAAGVRVVDDGTAATKLADYLASARLI